MRCAEKYKTAIKDYNRAIEINPKHFRAIHNRGLTKMTLISHYGDAYYNRAVAKINLGQKENACQDLKKGRRIRAN